VLKLLALPVVLLTVVSGSATQMHLSARWLLLEQVALHIRGRLTTAGHPVAGQPIRITANGRGGAIRLGHTRSAADGSFGLHYRVVALSTWRHRSARRALQRKFRYVTASFPGSRQFAPAVIRIPVAAP
jgi:hypothetical protein